MNLHTITQCMQVTVAIKKQLDYLQNAILSEDDRDCMEAIEQIEYLIFKLKEEKKRWQEQH